MTSSARAASLSRTRPRFEPRQRATVRPRGEDHVCAAVDGVAHGHGTVGHQTTRSGDDRDATGLEEALQTLVLLRDDALAVRRDAGGIDALQLSGDADGAGRAYVIGDLGRVQERLRRNAAPVQARPPDFVLLDEDDRLPSSDARMAAA
jgi:hypothetical protein